MQLYVLAGIEIYYNQVSVKQQQRQGQTDAKTKKNFPLIFATEFCRAHKSLNYYRKELTFSVAPPFNAVIS